MFSRLLPFLLILSPLAITQEECPQDDDDVGSPTPVDSPTPVPTPVPTLFPTPDPGHCTESGGGAVPPGVELLEIAHDSGTALGTLQDLIFNPFTGYEGVYNLNAEEKWEAVRFDLTAPATVYRVRVMWDALPAGDRMPVELGAYPDFGSNGFDFWQWDPLRTGTRCLNTDDNGKWVEYVFDPPIEVDQPGLFYIAHFWTGPEIPR